MSAPQQPRGPFQPSPDPDRPAPCGPGATAPPGRDFATPVELRCILRPEQEMKRMLPVLIVGFLFISLCAAVAIGLFIPDGSPVVIIPPALVIGALFPGWAYWRIKTRLTRTYGEQQRLWLTPQGLRRTDGHIMTDMPWSGIDRIEVRNSSIQGHQVTMTDAPAVGMGTNAALNQAYTKIAAGIVGRATITPVPGASRAMLKRHDQTQGGRSKLRKGQPYDAPQGLIFPGEFEEDWAHGIVGAWLLHYRPDIASPA